MTKDPNRDQGALDEGQNQARPGISRRDFLKGAAAGAAGFAIASYLPACGTEGDGSTAEAESATPAETAAPSPEASPEATLAAAEETAENTPAASGDDWLGEAPDITDVAQTVDVDVVVVGAGLAGVCAARAAAEEGATVALIEKAAQANCRSGEYAVLGGSLNERIGRADIVSADMVTDRFMQECSYRIKRPIIARWAEEAHQSIDWYIEAKPDLYLADSTRAEIPDENKDAFLVPLSWPLPERYNYLDEDFPTFPSSFEFRPSQAPVFNANVDAAVGLGAQVYYAHKTEKLEKDGDRVSGVIARDIASGNYIRFNAAKGVILATGDNGNNPAMLSHFCPQLDVLGITGMNMGLDAEGNPINTGDGVKMGVWAGAAVQNNHAPMTHHMGAGMGITPFLLLNKLGKRFTNECIPGQQLENQIELQPDYTSFQIFDDNWREQLQYMPPNHGACCYYDNDLPANNESDRQYMSDEIFNSRVEEGRILKADSIEELLDQLEIDKETALASIERYNALSAAGNDEDFNKTGSRMFALETGPFYACTLGLTSMLVCIGGLDSDEECRVYDQTLRPIQGLYAAGNVQGNRYAVEYPICMRGISHSMCVFYGHVAGKNAVNQV